MREISKWREGEIGMKSREGEKGKGDVRRGEKRGKRIGKGCNL